MTAPVATIASFVQPAAKLAMGDAAGAAVGGFEALLAMLTQSLQGGAEGQAPGEDAAKGQTVDTEATDDDLAALLGQAGIAPWLTQAMSQTEDGAEPVTCAATPEKGLAGAAPAEAETTPDPLSTLLGSQTPETIDPAIFEGARPVKNQASAQAAVPPLQSQAPTEVPPPVEEAVVIQAEVVAAQQTAEAEAPPAAETLAAPAVAPPPVEAKPSAPPRKSAAADAKSAGAEKTPAATASRPAAVAAAEPDTPAEDLAPVEVAAREAETPDAPARTPDAPAHTLAARLESAATAAAAATQVRGAPETVAKLAAGILDRLDGQSTRFDLQFDPHGLGKVDVSVEIGSDGRLTAQLGFDSQLGLSELRGRAQELRTALEQAGFTLADNALSFDFSGERRQQQTAESNASNNEQAGKAFARAMGALDEELAAAPTRYQARRGLDLLI